jgi:hypothetical protein
MLMDCSKTAYMYVNIAVKKLIESQDKEKTQWSDVTVCPMDTLAF